VDTLEAAFGIQDQLLLGKTDVDISRDLKAAMTIGIKIRLVTGTYFLQEVRAKYACVSPLL
jgi:hypothetical protein